MTSINDPKKNKTEGIGSSDHSVEKSGERSGVDNRRFLSVTDVKFQREFVGLMVFVAISSILIMLIGSYSMIQHFATLAAQLSEGGGSIESEVHSQMQRIWLMMIGVALVNCAGIGIFGFWFSKRVSGIIFRMTKDLNRFADGEKVEKITPREGDFFLGMVEAVNRVITSNRK